MGSLLRLAHEAMQYGETPRTCEEAILGMAMQLAVENDALRERVRELTPPDWGITDLHTTTRCIRVTVEAAYTLEQGEYPEGGGVADALALDDDALWEWAGRRYHNRKYEWSYFTPVTVEEHEFPYTLRRVSVKDGASVEATLVTDGTDGKEMHAVDELELGRWVDESARYGLYDLAREELRDRLRDAARQMDDQKKEGQ